MPPLTVFSTVAAPAGKEIDEIIETSLLSAFNAPLQLREYLSVHFFTIMNSASKDKSFYHKNMVAILRVLQKICKHHYFPKDQTVNVRALKVIWHKVLFHGFGRCLGADATDAHAPIFFFSGAPRANQFLYDILISVSIADFATRFILFDRHPFVRTVRVMLETMDISSIDESQKEHIAAEIDTAYRAFLTLSNSHAENADWVAWHMNYDYLPLQSQSFSILFQRTNSALQNPSILSSLDKSSSLIPFGFFRDNWFDPCLTLIN